MSTDAIQWWWLSFCDPGRPQGNRFLGCAIVASTDMTHAIITAHRLGINPGGEVVGAPVPDDVMVYVQGSRRNVLLTKAQTIALDTHIHAAKAKPS